MDIGCKEIQLSIVVPVYNAEKYIKECITSILKIRTFLIEVLIVDNGSIDQSIEICKKIANNDKRVRIAHEKKKGAAAARNHGVRKATGKYITFIDSDDYINPEIYESILNVIFEKKIDCACFSFNYVDELGKSLGWYEPKYKKYGKTIKGNEAAAIFLTSNDIEGFGWNKIFRRQIILDNDFQFDETKRVFEDMVFSFMFLLSSSNVILFNEKPYFYRQRDESLVHSTLKDDFFEYLKVINQISDIAEVNGLHNECKVYLLVRDVQWRYEKMKRNRKCNVDILNKIYIIRAIYLIMKYQKSEKMKYLFKLLIVILGK